MNELSHPDSGLLIQYLDGELSDEQFLEVRGHLSRCPACRRRQEEFASLSDSVQKLVAGEAVGNLQGARAILAKALADRYFTDGAVKWGNVMRRFGWGMGVAAALAVGVFLAPRIERKNQTVPLQGTSAETATIDINGESFIPLPYSNPDLPLNAPRIVEMRVPVSSLTEAGIVFEPTSNNFTEHTVLANVLLGLDGQPMGVHVLSAD
jgi:putative zinc finger protein